MYRPVPKHCLKNKVIVIAHAYVIICVFLCLLNAIYVRITLRVHMLQSYIVEAASVVMLAVPVGGHPFHHVGRSHVESRVRGDPLS
jgi:membrane protein YdbS with pleckstrin-like domain